ncbi:MAG: macro domain-containing protein [Rubrobacteraceae bacterium]
MDGLWSAVRTRAGGEPMSVPLIGGGLLSIGLPPYQLLQMIILSIIIASKNGHIRSEIRILIARGLMEEIDLDALESQWS